MLTVLLLSENPIWQIPIFSCGTASHCSDVVGSREPVALQGWDLGTHDSLGMGNWPVDI